MNIQTVLIVGSKLLARGISELLDKNPVPRSIVTVPSGDEVLSAVQENLPDLVIFAEGDRLSSDAIGQILTKHPGLPIMWANLDTSHLQVITSERVFVGSADIQAVLTRLLNFNNLKL